MSLFTGAIWKCHGTAFEEYSVTKKWKWRKYARPKPYYGRQDLYIIMRHHEFIGEVKDVWVALTNKSLATIINQTMTRTRRDVKRSSRGSARRLAIVFAKMRIKQNRKHEITKLLESCLKNLEKKVYYSCCAWVFPGKSRTFTSQRYRNSIYPGVAVFIHEI